MNSDEFDITKLRLDQAAFTAPPVPSKIRKRREQFVMVPMRWYENLAKPVPTSRCTCLVALYVLPTLEESRQAIQTRQRHVGL